MAFTLSTLLLVAHLPIMFLLLARFGYRAGLSFETADPVLCLAWLLAPLVLLGGEVVITLRIVAGVRSARALARETAP